MKTYSRSDAGLKDITSEKQQDNAQPVGNRLPDIHIGVSMVFYSPLAEYGMGGCSLTEEDLELILHDLRENKRPQEQ